MQICITESDGENQSFMGSDFKVFQPWAEPGEGSTVAELKQFLCMSIFNSPQGTQVRANICTRRPDEVELVYLGQGESNYGNLIECQHDMTAWVDDPAVGPDPKKEEHVTFSLFESFVGYGLPSRENKEIQRIQHALKLADCRVGPSKEDSLDDLDDFGDFPFWITDEKKKLVFGAEDAHTQRDWIDQIDAAILVAQNHHRETAAVRDDNRGNILLDSMTLADYKIKQGDCFAIVPKPGMSVARGGGSEPEPEMHSVETSSLVETGEGSFGRTTPGFDDGERSDAQVKEELMDSEAHEGDEDFKEKVVTTSGMPNLQRAAAQFVSKSKEEIIDMLRETIEGHQRAIMAKLTVDEIYKDRLMFQRKVRESAGVDLAKMGLRVISYTLTSVPPLAVTVHVVDMLGGGPMEVNVSPDWSVSRLNATIAAGRGISAELQRLVVGEVALDDADALLSSCGVGEGTLVHVTAQEAGAAAERAAAAAVAAAATIAEGQPPRQQRRGGGWCCASPT
eukprot:COSAG06_NODE_3265_length_5594_cov_4.359054_4_plen_508_part_00